MLPLEPPDTWHLSSALGWLGLGNPAEAEAELAQVSAAQRQHPEVLETRWLVCAELKKWVEALQAARMLIHAAPERPTGWLHQAYALRRTPDGGLQQAWDALLAAHPQFPHEPLIPYNLSCYACQMGNLDAARTWLKRAFTVADKANMKQMALEDEDLRALWGEIADY